MSALVRVAVLLVLGLVVLGRGLFYLNDRLATSQRPTYPAAGAAPAATPGAPAAAAPAAPTPLPPPTDSQMLALQLARGDDLVRTLKALGAHAVTPELVQSLDATATREPYSEIQRFVACHKARADGAPLSQAFDALPAEPDDVDWHHDSTACVVDVIAARAEEDRERAIALFAARALESMGSSTVVRTLARLDPPELPAVLADALAQPQRRRHRINAATTAVAIGAAAKWPDLVDGWLGDEQLGGHVLQGLAARTDEASMRFLAREISASPRDPRLLGIAERSVLKPGTLDLQLAAVAADPEAASFARGHAAHLVGLYGGEDASRRLAVVKADDPSVTTALTAAWTNIDQRFGPNLRGGASR